MGLATAVGVASSPAWKTRSRCMTPSCVAARPTPMASCITSNIRSASRSSSGPKLVTSEARDFSTGSPKVRIWARASARRLRASGSSPSTRSSGGPSGLTGCDSSTVAASAVSLIKRECRSATESSLRIDVDADRRSPQLPRPGQALDRGPDGRHTGLALCDLEEELATVAAAEAKPGRGPEQVGAAWKPGRYGVPHALGRGLRRFGLGGGDLDADHVGERRVAERAAALELPGEEALRVVGGGVADRGRLGRQGLDQHPAAALAAAASPGELRDQGEGALLRTEVREAERGVGVEDDAEDDVREVVALGDTLGSDQDAGLSLVEAL